MNKEQKTTQAILNNHLAQFKVIERALESAKKKGLKKVDLKAFGDGENEDEYMEQEEIDRQAEIERQEEVID